MKVGDKVRFLNEVGGGIVAGFQGKNTVLVEDEDGFEIPMLITECVVIDTNDYNIPVKATDNRQQSTVNGQQTTDNGQRMSQTVNYKQDLNPDGDCRL